MEANLPLPLSLQPRPDSSILACEPQTAIALRRAAENCLQEAEMVVRQFEDLVERATGPMADGKTEAAGLMHRIAAQACTIAEARHCRIIDPALVAAFVRSIDPWAMASPAARSIQSRPESSSPAGWGARALRQAPNGLDAVGEGIDQWFLETPWAKAQRAAETWLRTESTALLQGRPGAWPLSVRLLSGSAPLQEILRQALSNGCGRPVRVGSFSREVPEPDVIIAWGDLDVSADADALRLLDAAHSALRPGGTLIHVGLAEPGALAGFTELLLDWPVGVRNAKATAALVTASAFGNRGRLIEDDLPIVRVVARRDT